MTENKGKFVKGDPRCWRKGRPKAFDAARELAQVIAGEKAKMKNGDIYVVNDHAVTYIEAILRNWAMSGDVQKQKAFVEYAYGKVPSSVEVAGPEGGPVQVEDVNETRRRLLESIERSVETDDSRPEGGVD